MRRVAGIVAARALAACQPDLAGQPKYETFDASPLWADGSSARPPPPGRAATLLHVHALTDGRPRRRRGGARAACDTNCGCKASTASFPNTVMATTCAARNPAAPGGLRRPAATPIAAQTGNASATRAANGAHAMYAASAGSLGGG